MLVFMGKDSSPEDIGVRVQSPGKISEHSIILDTGLFNTKPPIFLSPGKDIPTNHIHFFPRVSRPPNKVPPGSIYGLENFIRKKDELHNIVRHAS